MILALLLAAKAAVVTAPGPCGSMNANTVYLAYVASDGSCSSGDDRPCNANAVIQFAPLSLYYNFSCMTHWFHWEFGDGSTTEAAYPTHIFAGAGEETVSVTIDNGMESVRLARNIVVRAPIFGEFGFDYTTDANVVRFKVAPYGTITSWTLDFGDGTSAVLHGANPSEIVYRYEKAGTYSVTLNAGAMTSVRVITITIPRSRAVRH